MKAIYFINFCLELQAQTDFLTKGLLSWVVFFDKDCLFIIEIGVVLAKFLDLSEDLAVLLFVQFFIALDDLLPANDLAGQGCNLRGGISLDLADDCYHSSFGAILEDNRVDPPDCFENLHVTICQLTN
jgi:hypothetical protein